MQQPAIDHLRELLAPRPGPCLSLYQPTHRTHPANAQDPIRYGNLLGRLRESLHRSDATVDARALLAPLEALADDGTFWNHTLDGLAIFSAAGLFRVYGLQRVVPELAIVAHSFHCKPLIRALQSALRFQVLTLTRDAIRLYEGDRDALDAVELAPGVPHTMTEALGTELTENRVVVSAQRAGHVKGSGPGMRHGHGSRKDEIPVDDERWFRAVDRAVHERHSQASRLPLLLVALAEHQGTFRRVSGNPYLLEAGIQQSPDSLSATELREAAWSAVEPQHVARLERLAGRFAAELSRDRAAEELDAVAEAAATGRIETLLVAADRRVPGRLDAATGGIERAPLEEPDVDDVLDDLAEQALRTGADVLVVPPERMPSRSGVAAIYRY